MRDILLNKFVPEKYGGILEYGRDVLKLSKSEMADLVREVAFGCLEIGCKGKMLKKLVDTYDHLSDEVAVFLLKNYRLFLEDVPCLTEGVEIDKACGEYEAPLCTEFISARRSVQQLVMAGLTPAGGSAPVLDSGGITAGGQGEGDSSMHPPPGGEEVDEEVQSVVTDNDADENEDSDLVSIIACHFIVHAHAHGAPLPRCLLSQGQIGQDTLTMMIRKEELAPSRRRRYYSLYTPYSENLGKLTYPAGMFYTFSICCLSSTFRSIDYTQVGRWIKQQYGPRSAVAAVYMIHAVINENVAVREEIDALLTSAIDVCEQGVQASLYADQYSLANRVPLTLKHFKMLARLGRAPVSFAMIILVPLA